MATKVLKLVFKNSKGKKSNLTLQNPKDNLDEATVKVAMESIVKSNVFEKEEVNMYASVVGAKYYTTQSDDIFTTEDADDAE